MDKLIDPASASGAVLWGVVAGILTTFLLFLFGLMFTQVIIPWYETLVYRGWDVSGLWVYRQNLGGVDYGYQMALKQHAHRLSGTMTITKSGAPAGPRGDYVQTFGVSGTTWEGFLTLNMQSSDRKSLAFATSLLQVENRGRSMVGQLCYRSSGVGQVGSETIDWTRDVS
ncbi:MAG TPA: hypothetical protein VKB79_08365 [Bryobacteraceae bacterium]|nr:hypothetical protein [Bryobacteraceae bacterium]